MAKSKLSELLEKRDAEITSQWLESQTVGGRKVSAAEQGETTRQSREFIQALKKAVENGVTGDINGPEWEAVKEILTGISSSRARAGYSPSETASFVFSLKLPLFSVLRAEYGKDAQMLADGVWETTILLDKLGLLTTELHQKTREDIIARQQQELLELSTPVVRLWDN
ncbi:MAG TPA: RsbRD N-terminal domain-containing protein, partial [Bryobacteraceae bacterium]